MKTSDSLRPQLRQISDLIDGIDYAMLTSRESDGTLHTRPMKTEALQADGSLLFFTQASSAKAREIETNPQVSISYMSGNADVSVAVAGRARLLRDPQKMKSLWKPLYKAWFPQGLEDPELTLLAVTIERAEYWKTPANVPVRLLGAAKAITTGEPAGTTGGEHERLQVL